MNAEPAVEGPKFDAQSLLKNVLAGLTVSFVAISLGAAFGIASGRPNGAFIGILSAGVIALITSLLGGTRVQCSGPTAPMTAVTAAVVLAATTGDLAGTLNGAGVDQQQFINQVFLLTGALLLLMAVFRLGRFIQLVPKVVISGFMNGIAVLILIAEFGKLFGLGDHTAIGGELMLNVAIAGVTLALCFVFKPLLKKAPKFLAFIPGALFAIVVVTAGVQAIGLTTDQVEFISLAAVSSLADVSGLFEGQFPTDWSGPILFAALPFALNLAMLAYLDTLLTSLVVDKMATRMFNKKEETKQNKELAAQGVANGVIALFGGIPGAQATIRSVLILNENATMRIAGVLVGVFVIVEMLIFQGALQLIPKAVFTGILLKVGYDVMDWEALGAWWRSLRSDKKLVTNAQIGIIAGTTIVTVLVNLNVAVVAFGVLFHVLKRTRFAMSDLTLGQPAPPEPQTETAAG
ncbi:MAG: SulP family inorganic anion transporter [Proteobacteria bacterium]|nr:SulP family inorganic anion transporter [Pseudomonadota bacterium]MCP4916184.1 SulP family inorganic anion transporter [Pseudomonadota bacterium]